MTTPSHLVPDDTVEHLDLDELGWVDVDPDRDDITALRTHLENHNGITGLEVLEPHEVERATRIFYRDGFVVVRNALTVEQLASIREGCDEVIHDIASRDGRRHGRTGKRPHPAPAILLGCHRRLHILLADCAGHASPQQPTQLDPPAMRQRRTSVVLLSTRQ